MSSSVGWSSLVWLASLLSPLNIASAQDQDATGALTILLRDDAGTLLPGGSYQVIDQNGVAFTVADADDG